MGYDIDAYFDDEYSEMVRAPGWNLGDDNQLEKAEKIATLSMPARSPLAPEIFKALHVEEYDGGVSGNAGSQYFTRPEIIAGIQFIGFKIAEEPQLDKTLEFLVTILIRMNRASDPANAVVHIWFC